MVDNFEIIKSYIDFTELQGSFFHCQIIQRKKDNPSKRAYKDIIKTYLIRSKEQLDGFKDEIITLCETFQARAYINISSKRMLKLQKALLLDYTYTVLDEHIRNPYKVLVSTMGKLNSDFPRWIVDIDDISKLEEIKNTIIDIYSSEFDRKKIAINSDLVFCGTIPTPNGLHLITRPFNLEEFKKRLPDTQVHKNSMGTLLYYPNSIEKNEIN